MQTPAKYKISHLSSLLQDLQSSLTQKKHLIVFNSEISGFPKYFHQSSTYKPMMMMLMMLMMMIMVIIIIA